MLRRARRQTIAPLVALFGVLFLFAAVAASAQQPLREQLLTASRYAGYAAQSTSIGGVHAHLQQALNCLAGPGGEGYDTSSFDPCQPLRQRALVVGARPAPQSRFDDALRYARSGLRMESVEAAQAAARATQGLVDEIAGGLGSDVQMARGEEANRG